MKLLFTPLTAIAALLLVKACLGKVKEDSIGHNGLSEDFYPTPDDYEQNYFDVLPGGEAVYVTLEPSTVYITVTETIAEQEIESAEIRTSTFLTTKLTTEVETETETKNLPISESSYSAPIGTSNTAIHITIDGANTVVLTSTKYTKYSQPSTSGELSLVFGTDTLEDFFRDTPTETGWWNKDLTAKDEYTVVPSTTDIIGSNHVTSSTLEISSEYFEHILTNDSSSKRTKETSTLIPKTSFFSEEVLKLTKNETDVLMNTLSHTHKDIDTKYDNLEEFSPYSDLPTADFDLSNAGSSNFNLKMGTVILGAATIFFIVGTIVL